MRKFSPRATSLPTNVSTQAEIGGVVVSWAYAFGPIDSVHFEVRRDGAYLASTTSTSYGDVTATAGVTYAYDVEAVRTNPINNQQYRSGRTAPVDGSWQSSALADIEILTVTNATSGVSVTINPVTGATGYRLLRSPRPLDGFAQVGSDFAGTTLTDATGTAGVFYYYKAAPVTSGVMGTASASRVGTKLGATGADAIALGTLTLAPNFNVIHIDLAVTGDTDESARAQAEFGVDNGSGQLIWQHAIVPLMRRGSSFIGACVELEEDTTYSVHVTVTDTGGVSSTLPYKLSTVKTRLDTARSYDELIADTTHYVDFVNGNDARTATQAQNASTPLKTTNQAIILCNSGAIPSGSVIQVKAGFMPVATTQLTASNIGWVTENPATLPADADDFAPYNAAEAHTVVYNKFTAPAGSDLAGDALATTYGIYGKGGWSAHAPVAHPTWIVYGKDIGSGTVTQCGYVDATLHGSYAEAKAAETYRVTDIQKDGTAGRLLNTLDGFCEFIYTNITNNQGFWQNGTTLYVRLKDDVHPDNCYLWMGTQTFSAGTFAGAFDVAGTNIEIAGFNARNMSNGFRARSTADNVTFLRNYTRDCGCPYVPFKALDGVGSKRITIQDFRCDGSGSWSEALDATPWEGIKQQYALAYSGPVIRVDGTLDYDAGVTFYPKNRVSSYTEISAVKFVEGGVQWVIRRGEIDGIFNGVGSTGASVAVGAQRDIDIHDIRFKNVADNCIEPEGMATGWVGWNHYVENSRSYISTDSDGGAHIFYRWTAWQWGVHGIAPVVQGETSISEFRGGNGQLVKFGAGAEPRPHYWLMQGTAWTNKAGSRGFGKAIGSSSRERFHLRNVIIRCTDDAIDNQATITEWDIDYCWFASELAGQGVTIHDRAYNRTETTGLGAVGTLYTIEQYRADGYGDNVNLHSGTYYNFVAGGLAHIDALIPGRLTGDLTLSGSLPGIPLPNLDEDGATANIGYEAA